MRCCDTGVAQAVVSTACTVVIGIVPAFVADGITRPAIPESREQLVRQATGLRQRCRHLRDADNLIFRIGGPGTAGYETTEEVVSDARVARERPQVPVRLPRSLQFHGIGCERVDVGPG